MAPRKRPRTPMWKAGAIPRTKRYGEGGKINTSGSGKSSSKKKSS